MVGDGSTAAGVGLGRGELAAGAVVGIGCVGVGSVGAGCGVGETLCKRSSPRLAGVATISSVGVEVAGSETAGAGVVEHAARKMRPAETIGALKVALSGVNGVCRIVLVSCPSPCGRAGLTKAQGDSVIQLKQLRIGN